MGNRKSGKEPKYPKGILTQKVRFRYCPEEMSEMPEWCLKQRYPNTPLEKIPLLDRYAKGKGKFENEEIILPIINALSKELGCPLQMSDPDFWKFMTICLIVRHVPAFQLDKSGGRKRKSPEEHRKWLDLYVDTSESIGHEPQQSVIIAAIAKKKKLSPSVVKANVWRAYAWLQQQVKHIEKAEEIFARVEATKRH
jgi:hypothetical protein